MIDVKLLMKSLTQQELLAAAEAYYASIADPVVPARQAVRQHR